MVVRGGGRRHGADGWLLRRIVDPLSGQRGRSRLCQGGVPVPLALDGGRPVDDRDRRGLLRDRDAGIGGLYSAVHRPASDAPRGDRCAGARRGSRVGHPGIGRPRKPVHIGRGRRSRDHRRRRLSCRPSHCLDHRRCAAAGRDGSVRHRIWQPAGVLRLHRLRGLGQCRGGGEGPTPRSSARHDPDARHFDDPLCPGCRRGRQRRADRTARIVIGAAQPGLSRSRRRQSGNDQRDRHRRDPEHDSGTDDDGGPGRLRHRAGRRAAGDFLRG